MEKNVFTPHPFILTKPEWIPDSKASSCVLCKERFTQVRRRHHCRVCGNVLCGKCCFEKVYLPQYGDDEQSRVCNACLPVSIMITKARSLQMASRLESAKSLADACAEEKMLKKVVETGGVQAIIHLAQTNIADIKETVAEALNNLALCIPLHSMVVDCGGVKAICSILSSTGDSHSQATIKALSTLKLLAKSEKLKVLIVAEGALVPLMALSMSTNNTTVVLSLTTLGIILENPINVATFAQNFKNGLQTMLRIAKSNDEKVQEVSLRILALLARTTDELRKKFLKKIITVEIASKTL
ncbi:zinc finger FYVE domain-containing protein 26-like [Xenia sp. Carnegie-2017]|uniref:zinc finger FYVE domain-containing protein 26-like n=1 Tax=Xenia sp. Carnegie-2017 TaxID=2897299 RepID=UPI001F04424D|nr:zinc finger FYVE domain-containing protein 26-like [Xenia sp. Carnegie-2017]XP_046860308.1 zinc finger FYVE domain-containing protein 26-like [Xenia sp. Carnegie-2017]XP_046860309.1 zinc finger FYVE domain-containing protein 26-like [Xenia sp. Carnegie-2017]